MNNDNKLIPKYRFPAFKDEGNWSTYAISEISEFRRGSFPQPYGLPEWYDKINGFPFIQVFDVDENLKLKPFTKNKISLAAANQSVFIKAGTLIVTLQGSIGRVAITQYDAYIDRTLLIFDDYKIDIDKYFYAYIIKLIFEIEKEKAPGGIIKTITKEVLSKFIVKIPTNPSEQQKIAACLSSLDDVIAGHEEKLTALEEHKKGLMQNLFPQEGETQPKYRFPEFENDGDWVEKNILEISSIKARIGWQNLRTEEHLPQGEYYLVTGTDFKNNRVDWDNAKYVSHDRYIQDEHIILKEGDILITKDGSIGKVAYVNNINNRKSTLNNGIFRIRIFGKYDSEFIFHSFLSSRFKIFLDKLSGGSSIVHLYQKDFEKYAIQLPINIAEQKKIASVLSSVDELIVAQREKTEALREHKKGLMQGLFPKIEA